MVITKTCNTCEHYPNDEHCIGCEWDNKGGNTRWELKKNPIVIERAVLDKIRAEIKEEISDHVGADNYDAVYGLQLALYIINKYKAESEE